MEQVLKNDRKLRKIQKIFINFKESVSTDLIYASNSGTLAGNLVRKAGPYP